MELKVGRDYVHRITRKRFEIATVTDTHVGGFPLPAGFPPIPAIFTRTYFLANFDPVKIKRPEPSPVLPFVLAGAAVLLGLKLFRII